VNGAGRSAVVIGAGPAGSSAAIHLARAGWRVTIAEARAFPRIKVCGEFISPAATRFLEDLVASAALEQAWARRIRDLVIEEGERQMRFTMPTGGTPGAWVLSRASLDTLLLERACSEGVRVVQPARVDAVAYADDQVEVTIDGVREAWDIVVHADGSGRHDTPNHTGDARTTPNRPGVVGRKCHAQLPGESGGPVLRMRAARGAYIGSVAVENGRSTIALVASNELVARYGRDADAMLASVWPRFDPAWRDSEWLSCGVASGPFMRGSHPRSFRVGNAAAAVEPVGGEGIGLALWAGAALADAISQGPTLADAQHVYAGAYRRRLRLRRPACALAAQVLVRPRLVRALWPVLAAPLVGRSVVQTWCSLTGKPGLASR